MMISPKLPDMVKSLTETPSVSSTLSQFDQSNLGVVDLLAGWLEPMGFKIRINPIENHPGKANLIATLGSGTGGLLLSGHTDTVPFDADLWQSDPLTLVERQDRWYGLGVCDMKSFLAICIAAAEPYANTKLLRPLTILGTADEESSMSGVRSITSTDLSQARFALIGEPTDLKPVNRHKGIMMLSLRITGQSGHSSNPDYGNNALNATGFVIEELNAFRQYLTGKYVDTTFEVAGPTLNLGCIHGGDNPNRICDHVELLFDLRIIPGMNNVALIEEIDQRIRHRLKSTGLDVNLSLLHPPVDAFESTGGDLLRTIASFNSEAPVSVAFATEAPFLTKLGIETIVMGPGSISQAHQPNEFLELAQVDPTIAIIRALIDKYCL